MRVTRQEEQRPIHDQRHLRIGGAYDRSIVHINHIKHEYRLLHFLISVLDYALGMATAATITIMFLYSANVYAVKFIVAYSMLLTFLILIMIYNGLDQLYIHYTGKVAKKYIVTWGVMHAVIILLWLLALFLVNVNYNPLVFKSSMSSLVWVD